MSQRLLVEVIAEVEEQIDDAEMQYITFPTTLHAIRLFELLDKAEQLNELAASIVVEMPDPPPPPKKRKTKSVLRNKRQGNRHSRIL